MRMARYVSIGLCIRTSGLVIGVLLILQAYLFAKRYNAPRLESGSILLLEDSVDKIVTSFPLPESHKRRNRTSITGNPYCDTVFCRWYNDSSSRSHNNSYETDLNWKFAYYDASRHDTIILNQSSYKYFTQFQQNYCLTEGTDLKRSNDSCCACKEGWYGSECSFPDYLPESDIPTTYLELIRPRHKARRIVYVTPFSIEFELMEARFAELGDLVDVFVVVESNYSGHGDPKPLRFLNALREGFANWIQQKILYVFLDHYLEQAKSRGWLADDHPRDFAGSSEVLNCIKNLRHDDLIILTDTDEIPARKTVLFTKVNDYYPEPFGYHMRRTTFGFFWLAGNGNWPISAGATVGMVRHVFNNKLSRLRNPLGHLPFLKVDVNAYVSSGGIVHPWKLGSPKKPVGWHCSSCFPPEGIKIKLLSAINADFPRWGDFPTKLDLDYISNLVEQGRWFDDRSRMVGLDADSHDYAPNYVMSLPERFGHITQASYMRN